MSSVSWRRMLKQWGDAILACGDVPALTGAATACFPPATDAAIADAERRLGVRLPPSYRAFLQVSNGWWIDGTAGPIRLWGVEQIGRLGDLDPELVAIWDGLGGDEGGPTDDPALLPNDHLADAIQISKDNDGFYLLNPGIEPEPGEWQAAFFANWVPGAACQPSFGAMMRELADEFLAAHPVENDATARPTNLSKPPDERIETPGEFIGELHRLGFFRYATAADTARIERDYLATHAECVRRKWHTLLEGPFASAGSALLTPWSGG